MTKQTIFWGRLYTTESLFQLFMVCVFPLHLWALLMAFRDFAWVAARTYVWDAIGLVSYTLTFALLETVAVFLLVLLLGLLVPQAWGIRKRTALAGILFLISALWAILAQLYYLLYGLPVWLIDFLVGVDHPLRVLWTGAFLLVTASVITPVLLIIKKENATEKVVGVFERITVVSSLYVFLDVIGIIIVIMRNILH